MFSRRLFLLVIVVLLVPRTFPVAQPLPQHLSTVRFNGIEFSYDPELFGTVRTILYDGTAFRADAPYYANIAPHTSFLFRRQNSLLPDQDWIGELRVYRISDIVAYAEPTYKETLEQLQSVHDTDLAEYATVNEHNPAPLLPYMPMPNATQVFRAHPTQLDCRHISGIEYYTYFNQAPEPLVEGSVLYTYQGITVDGAFYVSFSMPVEIGILENQISSDLDWIAFQAKYDSYINQTFAKISEIDPAQYSPNETELSDFVRSIMTDASTVPLPTWMGGTQVLGDIVSPKFK